MMMDFHVWIGMLKRQNLAESKQNQNKYKYKYMYMYLMPVWKGKSNKQHKLIQHGNNETLIRSKLGKHVIKPGSTVQHVHVYTHV